MTTTSNTCKLLISTLLVLIASATQAQQSTLIFATEEPVLVEPTATDSIIVEAKKYIGTPYKWGGKSPSGFDCAGFTRYIYSKFGYLLAPSAPGQVREGQKVTTTNLQPGDLVFYGGSRNKQAVGHVGIVTTVDDNGFSFIHASNKGVLISTSNEPYYKSRYICARRILN